MSLVDTFLEVNLERGDSWVFQVPEGWYLLTFGYGVLGGLSLVNGRYLIAVPIVLLAVASLAAGFSMVRYERRAES